MLDVAGKGRRAIPSSHLAQPTPPSRAVAKLRWSYGGPCSAHINMEEVRAIGRDRLDTEARHGTNLFMTCSMGSAAATSNLQCGSATVHAKQGRAAGPREGSPAACADQERPPARSTTAKTWPRQPPPQLSPQKSDVGQFEYLSCDEPAHFALQMWQSGLNTAAPAALNSPGSPPSF